MALATTKTESSATCPLSLSIWQVTRAGLPPPCRTSVRTYTMRVEGEALFWSPNVRAWRSNHRGTRRRALAVEDALPDGRLDGVLVLCRHSLEADPLGEQGQAGLGQRREAPHEGVDVFDRHVGRRRALVERGQVAPQRLDVGVG